MNVQAVVNTARKVAKREQLPAEGKLLSREDFDKYVKLRSMGYCVFCDKPAVDSHHVLDRKLFPDGGYYLGNGAAVCGSHHLLAEATLLTVEQVREKACIAEPVLPPGFSTSKVYDKWGNEVISSTVIVLGPLKNDTGCRKALIAGKKAAFLYDTVPYLIDESGVESSS